MDVLAQDICNIIYDYNTVGGIIFDAQHVIKWVGQFEKGDQKFILEEFLHLLKQHIYISQNDARLILIKKIKFLSNHFKFKDPIDFLKNVDFLEMQPAGKSQCILLKILDEELKLNFGVCLKDCGIASHKFIIYLDDILATGGTVFNHLSQWLKGDENGESNLEKVLKDEKIVIVSLFCNHTWGADNVRWRLKFAFNRDALMKKILFFSSYKIENHPTSRDLQKFNCAIPIKSNQPQRVMDYLNGLEADRYGEYAFRKDNVPLNEVFFSSAGNRIRLENILLNKGIELLNQVMIIKGNHRPLGITNPTKKNLGTGTLFFTWRNISNTTPIVFWWIPHNWYPLFQLTNRGN